MRSIVVPACLLLSLAAADVPMHDAVVAAQSLGRLAAEEEARRRAIRAPARVLTEDDLRSAPSPLVTPTGAKPSPPPTPASGAKRVLSGPAQYRGGAVPQIPVLAVSGGEVLLEASIDKEGRVTAIRPLRHTPPFTDAVAAAVRTWTFAPAEDIDAPAPGALPDPATRKPIESTVLVAAVFRPPALFAVTLGEPPRDVATPSEGVPYPLVPLQMPVYPAMALADGVVLLELDVAAHGGLRNSRILRSTPAFDAPALEAARTLLFRPARVHQRAAGAFVYVIAGFRQPVT